MFSNGLKIIFTGKLGLESSPGANFVFSVKS